MADKFIEKFKQLNTFMAAYMRDVTYTMHHSIQSFTPGANVIGRAYTVKGPDIYLNALESIPEDSIYVHAHLSEDTSVFSGLFAEMYGKSRGLIAAVIDGGIFGREATAECEMPTFARFITPNGAINRRTGEIQVPVVCGGVPVCPRDIIIGDSDGVVVIPRENEQDIYDNVDSFLDGLPGLFAKIAQTPGIVLTEHEALAEMFELKYAHPYDYWRYYKTWTAKWRDKYGS